MASVIGKLGKGMLPLKQFFCHLKCQMPDLINKENCRSTKFFAFSATWKTPRCPHWFLGCLLIVWKCHWGVLESSSSVKLNDAAVTLCWQHCSAFLNIFFPLWGLKSVNSIAHGLKNTLLRLFPLLGCWIIVHIILVVDSLLEGKLISLVECLDSVQKAQWSDTVATIPVKN